MKTVLVTGAGVRLGRAIALQLGRAGYDLILHAHSSKEKIKQLQTELQALGRQSNVICADFATPTGPKQVVDHILSNHQQLDAIVHNAGIYFTRPFAQVTSNDF